MRQAANDSGFYLHQVSLGHLTGTRDRADDKASAKHTHSRADRPRGLSDKRQRDAINHHDAGRRRVRAKARTYSARKRGEFGDVGRGACYANASNQASVFE